MVDGIICAAICEPYIFVVRNIGIFRLKSIAFKRLHFQRAEFDLEPLMFNEALLLISPVCVEIYMGSSIKDCFFCRNSSVTINNIGF
jgi:hypothetical protein